MKELRNTKVCIFFVEKSSKLLAMNSLFLSKIHAGFMLSSPQYLRIIQNNDHCALQSDRVMK